MTTAKLLSSVSSHVILENVFTELSVVKARTEREIVSAPFNPSPATNEAMLALVRESVYAALGDALLAVAKAEAFLSRTSDMR